MRRESEPAEKVDENESYAMALIGNGDAPGLPPDFVVPEKPAGPSDSAGSTEETTAPKD